MEFSLDKTPKEEINDFFNLYLDEAKLHDAGFGSEIIPTESFEEAVDRIIAYYNKNKSIPQNAKDSGVNYETPTELKTKIITQYYNSKIHLVSGLSDNDAQSGYYKNNEIKTSHDGIGIIHLSNHTSHWNRYYKNKIKKNPIYKKQLEQYGINNTNTPLKNMLLFVKFVIETDKCKNQQKRPNNGDYMVAVLYDGWRIIFGYDDTYKGDNNKNDFTFLETMYYVDNNNKTNNENNKNLNKQYISSIQNKTNKNYEQIKKFDDMLKANRGE